MHRLSLAPALLILLFSGCSHGVDEAVAKQATHMGVYALTTAGLSEITEYGAEEDTPLSMEVHFKLGRSMARSDMPLAFVTNLPNAVMADSKVFLLPSVDAGRWHKNYADGDDTKPIPSSTELVSGSVYSVTPSGLPKDATGYLCLLVKMPAGVGDRMYAIHLK